MSTSSVIQQLIDELSSIVIKFQQYVDQIIDIINNIKDWIADIITSISEGLDYVLSLISGNNPFPELHASHPTVDNDYLFV